MMTTRTTMRMSIDDDRQDKDDDYEDDEEDDNRVAIDDNGGKMSTPNSKRRLHHQLRRDYTIHTNDGYITNPSADHIIDTYLDDHGNSNSCITKACYATARS